MSMMPESSKFSLCKKRKIFVFDICMAFRCGDARKLTDVSF